jgi:hypothetical protein
MDSIKMVVLASNLLLLTGACFSEVVVTTGLTLFKKDS